LGVRGFCRFDFAVTEIGKMLAVDELKGDFSPRGNPGFVRKRWERGAEFERNA
jgi:hypothetical protein